jgi:hypothetical protein
LFVAHDLVRKPASRIKEWAVRQNAEPNGNKGRAEQSRDEHGRRHGVSSPFARAVGLRVLAMLSREALAL